MTNLVRTLCVALSLLLFSCQSEELATPTVTPTPPTITVTGVADNTVDFLYFHTEPRIVTITADTDWSIAKDNSWFTVVPSSGEAGDAVEVSIFCSQNVQEAREGSFTITANSGSFLNPCLTQVEMLVKQSGYKSASLVLSQLPANKVFLFSATSPETYPFSVLGSHNWTITPSDESWITLSTQSGVAHQETLVTVTAHENSLAQERSATLILNCVDPLNPNNAYSDTLTLQQRPFYNWDDKAMGYTYFADDFSWITPLWNPTYTQYGYPTVRIDGTNYNEYASTHASINDAFVEKGYTPQANCYVRYEGYVKLGSSSTAGNLTLPGLGIAAGNVSNLHVSFDAGVYATAAGNADSNGLMYVTILGEGSFDAAQDTKELVFTVKRANEWDRYSFLVYAAGSDTQLKFGRSGSASSSRVFLDNLAVTRAANFDPVVAETMPVVLPMDKEILLVSGTPQMATYAGEVLTYSIRVNKAWSATSSASWLKFTQVQCGTSSSGATVTASEVKVLANALPYNNTQVTVEENNTSEQRSAVISIMVDGVEVESIVVVQEASPVAADKIEITELENNQISLAAEGNAVVVFKVKATADWEIRATDSWYQVAPLSGKADTEATVVVIPQNNAGDARQGAFTVTAGTSSLVINVAQAGSFSSLPAAWSMVHSASDATKVNLAIGEWWVKSDDGLSELKAHRSATVSSGTQETMSYTVTNPNDGDRILMYGLGRDDWWRAAIPVNAIEANTQFAISYQYQSSATGPKHFALEWSVDGSNWSAINPKTEQVGDEVIQYTVIAPSAAKLNVSETFTVTTAVAHGTLYVRKRVSSNVCANGTGSLLTSRGGTSRICRNKLADGAAVTPIMKIEKQ